MEYGQAGAYQAYLTYAGLSDDIKKKIIALTMERMDEEESQEVRETVDILAAEMPKRIACYLSYYEVDMRHSEIEQFYTEFMKAFQYFRVLSLYE